MIKLTLVLGGVWGRKRNKPHSGKTMQNARKKKDKEKVGDNNTRRTKWAKLNAPGIAKQVEEGLRLTHLGKKKVRERMAKKTIYAQQIIE